MGVKVESSIGCIVYVKGSNVFTHSLAELLVSVLAVLLRLCGSNLRKSCWSGMVGMVETADSIVESDAFGG